MIGEMDYVWGEGFGKTRCHAPSQIHHTCIIHWFRSLPVLQVTFGNSSSCRYTYGSSRFLYLYEYHLLGCYRHYKVTITEQTK